MMRSMSSVFLGDTAFYTILIVKLFEINGVNFAAVVGALLSLGKYKMPNRANRQQQIHANPKKRKTPMFLKLNNGVRILICNTQFKYRCGRRFYVYVIVSLI